MTTEPNDRPPGQHLNFPEVSWPAATSEPPALVDTSAAPPPLRASIVATVRPDKPAPPPRVGLLDYLLWALCAAAFALLLALSADAGLILELVQ